MRGGAVLTTMYSKLKAVAVPADEWKKWGWGGVGSTEVSSVSSKVLKVYLGKLIQLLKVHVSYVDKVRFSEDLYFPCYRVRL